MDTNQWKQDTNGVKSMAEVASTTSFRPVLERKVRPQKDQALSCPRCHSTNTKFCYYNNYSQTQPRHFCKTCRRYWTEGGTLRNVPVGGGSRKNKRSTSASSQNMIDLNPSNISQFSSRNPKIHDGQDLNLCFPSPQEHHGGSQIFEFPKIESSSSNQLIKSFSSSSPNSTPFAALELLRTGISSRGMNSFITVPATDMNALYTRGFSFHDLKPEVGFSVDGLGSTRFGPNGVQENSAKITFPLGAMKQLSGTSEIDQNKGQQIPNGIWSGMLGGGAW